MANPNCPIPNNLNPLSPTGFTLSITKLPEVSFFCQQANLPEVELTSIEMPTPFSTIGVPGDQLKFGNLTVNFLVDEDLKNYKAVYNWLIGLGFPENYSQYSNLVANDPRQLNPNSAGMVQDYSDGTLGILGSNNSVVQSILFRDLHPISVSSLVFQSTLTDVQYLTGTAVFRYTYYNFA
jgi:hypothetical protein